jgi:hydroxyethylthiazole kinase-like uncharacterized protein yjeF
MNPLSITQQQVTKYLPERPRDSHKGLFGSVCVIGGAPGMTGAALLAGRAALKLGAGCVHVGLLSDNPPTVDYTQPELMLHNAKTAMQLPGVTVLAIGCGMGQAPPGLLLEAIQTDAALVLDADVLNILAQRPDLGRRLNATNRAIVLTPHPGEAARLLACSTEEIQADRINAVQQLAQRYGCAVVLKGADSLCATSEGLFINHTGNPGMSAPGMGDVLTGMIAAFLAQGLTADHALLLAVHLHGAAGDDLAKFKIAIGMTATEVTDMARRLLNNWIAQP